MPEIFKEPPVDAFNQHPCAYLFLEAAFEAAEIGSNHIVTAKRKELEAQFGLKESEAAALAYLAEHRVQEFNDELELDILHLNLGGV